VHTCSRTNAYPGRYRANAEQVMGFLLKKAPGWR
jgi:hypothetical protein